MSDQYFNHQELVKRFKLLATKEIPQMRVFDRHVGLFYARRVSGGTIDYTPVKINRPGMADAYGVINFNGFGVHVEIEFKSGKAVQTKDQKNWENITNNFMGAKYFLVRNEHDGIREIKQYINQVANLMAKWV